MTLGEFSKSGLLDVFAEHIQAEQAPIIMVECGLPRSEQPAFPRDGRERTAFWMDVGEVIASGRLPTGTDLRPLVEAAARRYPGLSALQPYRAQAETQTELPELRPPPAVYASLLVEGWSDIVELLNAARDRATELGITPDGVRLGYANPDGVVLQLNGCTAELAYELGRRLSTPRPGQRLIRTSVATTDFEDYLISRINIEGPDQRRFAINDIPASTHVREVGQEFMAQHYSDLTNLGPGKPGARREVVVDRETADGKIERLEPDKTLHEQNVGEGDTLSVSPETTAGSVNPLVRESALVRVREEVLDFAESHAGFSAAINSLIAPTEYLLRFRASSFGPPPAPGADPVEVENHEVFVFLPADFPMVAPQVFWQRPVIFHPNINPQNGAVCLGQLAEQYQPGLSFARLCQLLIDIAGYRNYAVEAGYNLEAQNWANSPEGKVAIKKRGGKSVREMQLNETSQPRRLWITPVSM